MKNVPIARKQVLSLALAVAALVALLLISSVVPHDTKLPNPPLKDLTKSSGVELGMHTKPRQLRDNRFTRILTSQFSFITDDGDIHWNVLHPSPTKYNFINMDRITSYAKAHGMGVQAHHLIWNESGSLPRWLKKGGYNQAQLMTIMHQHISTVVGHYKDKVSTWTVVNEAFTRSKHVYGLKNWWGNKLGGGTEYIDKAFIWAHEADPKAKLILNDFDNATENAISDAQYAYMKSAKARGVPIDGIGMQFHIDAKRPPEKNAIVRNMQRFGAIGFPVYITEFDILPHSVKGSDAYKAQLEARITHDVVRACIESKNCVSFSLFGMTDKQYSASFTHSRQRANLFTTSYQPKPAFYSFRSAWLGKE